MAGHGTLLAEQLFISPVLTDLLCLNNHLSEQLSAASRGLWGRRVGRRGGTDVKIESYHLLQPVLPGDCAEHLVKVNLSPFK